MKQIIGNRIYDTEKAKTIYSFRRKVKGDKVLFSSSLFFYYWTDVDIYKTEKGNYFLYYHPAEGYKGYIETVDEDEVKRIIKDLNPDKYIELFGKVDLEEA